MGLYSMDSIESAVEARMRKQHAEELVRVNSELESRVESRISEREEGIKEEHEKTKEDAKRKQSLLHEMVPQHVADSLIQGEAVATEEFEAVTIFFSDIVGEKILTKEIPIFLQVLQSFLQQALHQK